MNASSRRKTWNLLSQFKPQRWTIQATKKMIKIFKKAFKFQINKNWNKKKKSWRLKTKK